MTQLTDRFDNALAYASRIHRAQFRKGTTIPYVLHLLAVSSLTLQYGGDEDQAIAALLHDAAEDQGGQDRLDDIRSRFGEAVASIVADCTDSWVEPKPVWRTRKEQYIASLVQNAERSMLVSLADKTHNASAILDDLREYGDALWDRFTGGREGSLWYYRTLADQFAGRLPGALAREFSRTVTAIEAIAA